MCSLTIMLMMQMLQFRLTTIVKIMLIIILLLEYLYHMFLMWSNDHLVFLLSKIWNKIIEMVCAWWLLANKSSYLIVKSGVLYIWYIIGKIKGLFVNQKKKYFQRC